MYSIQCMSKENLKLAFEECYVTIEETTEETKNKTTPETTEKTTEGTKEPIPGSKDWLLITIIIVFILAFIAVITSVIVLIKRNKKQSTEANKSETSLPSKSSSIQSDSMDETARNIKPGQKFQILKFNSEELEKDMLSPKKIS